MFLSLVAVALTAAPRGLPDAELITWAPKASEVSTLLPFFARAGQGSVMVAPSAWRESAHPLLAFDVTRPESISAAGVAVSDGLALSVRGPISVGCHGVSDLQAFEAACKARLARFGTFFRQEAGGVVTLGARDGLNRVQAAALIKGKESCSISGSGHSIEKLLPEVTKALTGKPLSGPHLKAASELPAPQYFLLPERPQDPAARLKGWGALALSAKGDTLTVDTKSKGVPMSTLQGGGPSPFTNLAVPGVATVRARLAKTELPGLMNQVFASMPGARTLTPAAQELAPNLTGNVALVISRVKVTSGLRTAPARFFAVRFVLLAEAADARAALALVEAIDQKALAFREGKLEAGVSSGVVWLANDVEVKDAALAALPKAAGTQRHGGELDLDPKALSRALASVPLLEVVQSPELTGVLVAATELGPLLDLTARVRGWVDSTSATTQRAQLTWTLEPAPPASPDAGPVP
ncbi:MAG: hypothetical protein JNJ54_13300 [Myxococcaceae bacterium]|nr:hypothetical protein [Myxococcaceae bacterium]